MEHIDLMESSPVSLILSIVFSFQLPLLVFCKPIVRLARSYRIWIQAQNLLCNRSLYISFSCSLGSPPGWSKKINRVYFDNFLPLFEPARGSTTASLSICLRTSFALLITASGTPTNLPLRHAIWHAIFLCSWQDASRLNDLVIVSGKDGLDLHRIMQVFRYGPVNERTSKVLVPRPTSSERTKLSAVAEVRILASSVISIMKVDWPEERSS